MKLIDLRIENYKSINDLGLFFGGEDVVIFGINGTGKSTLLNAIVALFAPVIKSLTNKGTLRFTDDDITIGRQRLAIGGGFEIGNETLYLQRFYEKSKQNSRASATTYDKKTNEAFVKAFRDQYLRDERIGMPIFVYYGTNRAVLKVPERLKERQPDQLEALENAIDKTVDFESFFSWYRDRESKDTISMRNALAHGGKYVPDIMLSSVQKAISSMLDSISEIRIQRDPVRMTVEKNGEEIRIDLLSDGEKCTLALFGDLARRLCLANPMSDNPLNGSGMVLIDEIELHMHPRWQRRVLCVLRRTFPNVQFIVTTHSPQVLGETDDNIRVFAVSSETKEYREIGRLDGADSNLILEEYMGTPHISMTTQKLIDEINATVAEGDYNTAKSKLTDLEAITGANSEKYIQCRMFLERSQYAKDHQRIGS